MKLLSKYPASTFVKDLYARSDILGCRERIEHLFEALDGIEDFHFAQELDRDPHSRLWEMLLARLLRDYGYEPVSSDAGPDFMVKWNGRRIFIEAVCPSAGQTGHPDSVPEIQLGANAAQAVPVDAMVLRIASAVREKHLKAQTYLQDGRIHPEDAYVIAVSSSKLRRGSGIWPPLGVRALLGYGNPYLVFDRIPEEQIREGVEAKLAVIKHNKTNISTCPFGLSAMPEVSAVIYSDSCPLSIPFEPTKQSYIIHNPTAKHGISPGLLPLREIWTYVNTAEGIWKSILLRETE